MPTVPGYDVLELLASGTGCDVHRGTRRATGEQVAVKVPRTAAAAAGLAQEAAALRVAASPYVVPLVEHVEGCALVLGLAEGGSVAGLLARRGSLSAGEVVTVVGPLAEALAVVHGAGLVHGDVTPEHLLLTAHGMPLLAGLPARGRPTPSPWADPAVLAGGPPSPASDVWSLAAVCHALLAGSPPDPDVGAPLSLLAPRAPRPLLDAFAAALGADPGARPTAAELAAAVHASCRPVPVALTGDLHSPAAPASAAPVHDLVRHRRSSPETPAFRPEGQHRLAARRLAGRRVPTSLPAVGLAVMVAAGAVAVAIGAGRDAPGPGAPVVVGREASWTTVLEGIDRARATALAEADQAALRSAWAPGSDGLAADTTAVQRLVDSGRAAVGVRHLVVAVHELRVDGDRALLRVVDRLGAHELRDRQGSVVERVAARGERTWDVALVRDRSGRWLLSELLPAVRQSTDP